MSKRPSFKVGETWRLNHCRKGDLTLKFTAINGEWADAEIVRGRVSYMSDDNRLAQREIGRGTPGDIITTRISFLTLHEKVGP